MMQAQVKAVAVAVRAAEAGRISRSASISDRLARKEGRCPDRGIHRARDESRAALRQPVIKQTSRANSPRK